MTIWGTFVFAKPLGRAVRRLREELPAEHLPAMNHLVHTLAEYLQATDLKARDIYHKAIGQSTHIDTVPALATPSPLPPPLSDEEIDAIMGATCKPELGNNAQDLMKFARAIEARVRMGSLAQE